MMGTNRNPHDQHLQQEDDVKLDNPFRRISFRKAAVFVCLFVCSPLCLLQVFSQDWKFDSPVQRAYENVLNLRIDEAMRLLPKPTTAEENYVLSLAESMDLILTEDGEKYENYHDAYEARLERRTKSSLPEDLFFQAELRLQWSFVYLKFGHEFDAAWNLRQSYLRVRDCQKRFPDFVPIKKTNAILEILVGSVPEKFSWILTLMGMQGSVTKGLEELEALRIAETPLQTEGNILYAILQGFVFQNPDTAVTCVKAMLIKQPQNKLLNFVGASLAIKAAQSDEALDMLSKLEQTSEGIPLHYAYYLKGEVYLHKAHYANAIAAYRWFLKNYKGQHYIKDAYYKIGLCYYLKGNKSDALAYFKQAKLKGREDTEADKYAARNLSDDKLPNVALARVRYFTDGGYYDQARTELDSIKVSSFTERRDEVEYYYRSARLAHRTGELEAAKKYYVETVRSSGKDDAWYFAPNASLQMGYIAAKEGKIALAKGYFMRAREYPKHAYKNSIDSKAKSALDQLKTLK
jgi:tetratricopeptide (TPR) repeat protein